MAEIGRCLPKTKTKSKLFLFLDSQIAFPRFPCSWVSPFDGILANIENMNRNAGLSFPGLIHKNFPLGNPPCFFPFSQLVGDGTALIAWDPD